MAKIFRIHTKRQGQVTQVLKPISTNVTIPISIPILSPLNATLSKTLSPLVLSSSGFSAPAGTRLGSLTKSLGVLSLSSTSALKIKATFSKSLGNLTLSSASKLLLKSSVSKTLGGLSLTATGISDSSSIPFNLGVGLISPEYWTYTAPTVDGASAAVFNYSNNSGDIFNEQFGVPEANRDTDGYPKSMPAGATYLTVTFQLPATNAQRKITWSSKAGGTNQGLNTPQLIGGTGITYDLPNKTITYTPDDPTPQASQTTIYLKYIPNSTTDYPIIFQDKPVVDPGTYLNSYFTTGVQGATASSAPIRFMDWTSVNRNSWVIDYTTCKFPADGDGQLGEPIYTSANRNKNPNDPIRRDGVPVETIIAVATALNRDIWYNMPWNADSTFYTDVAALFAAFSLSTGHKVYIEQSNEVWNSGFTVNHQCFNEAAFLGLTSEERYAQKAVASFAFFESAFASSGVTSKLVRVLAWQNYGSPSIWDSMMAFGTTASHVDAFAVAPYYGDNGNMGVATSYNTSISALAALVSTDMDDTLNQAVGHLAKAQSYGKAFCFYEMGLTIALTDPTFGPAFARSSEMYDLELRFMQQIEIAFPSTLTACSYGYAYPLDNSHGFEWGLIEYGSQTLSKATTPKWKAHSDFLSGTRVLADATGTLSKVGVSSAIGTSLGVLRPSAKNVVWSLTNNDSGKIVINSTTGNVTVASALTTGTRNITVRQTLGAATKDTTFSYTTIVTTWSPTTSNAAYTLSSGDTVATRASGSGDVDVIANTGHTTGTQSFTVTPNRSSGIYFIGLVNASESNTNYIGSTANSIGIFNSDGNIYKGGSAVASPGATLGNTTPITVILKNSKVYFQVNGIDVTGMNSTAETGGLTPPTGSLFPAADASGICSFTLDSTNWN